MEPRVRPPIKRANDRAENYRILVDDAETIQYSQQFSIMKRDFMQSKHKEFEVSFYIPFPRIRNEASIYHFSVISENWLEAEDSAIIDLRDIELPPEDYAHTKLENRPLLPVSALENPTYERLYTFPKFNKVQTQVFDRLYKSDENILVGAPTGSGKTIIGELAMLRAFTIHPKEKVVYIAPLKALTKERLNDWSKRLPAAIGRNVVELTGDFTPDMRSLLAADLVVTTPEKWDGITRHWEHREYVQKVSLLLIDEIHLLGQERGPVLEVIVSRMRTMAEKLKKKVRFVGLSTALANARDVASWLGVKESGLFNFAHSERPVPLTVHVDGFSEKAYCPRMASMNKPAYAFIHQYSHDHPVLIFVSSRRQTRLTALDLISFSTAQFMMKKPFLHETEENIQAIISRVNDEHLQHTLMYGIGMHHAGLTENDRKIVEELFVNQKIQVLVTTSTLAWGVNFPARLVIVKGTEFYDYKTRSYIDFPMTDLLQMIGRAGRPQFDDRGIAYILVQQEKKDFYQKFLYDPFPVESRLHTHLHDHINAEIVGGNIHSLQDTINYISNTYFYRRLIQNPRYYGVASSKSHEEINIFLSKLSTSVLNDLYMAGCVTVDEKHVVESTDLGYVASFFYISYKTVQLFAEKLKPLQGSRSGFLTLIELLTEATEFDGLPVRHCEEALNAYLANLIPVKLANKKMEDPHLKAGLLLLAYFLDVPFPITDFVTDTKSVLDQCVRVIQGMIEISKTKGYLDTLITLINILQMVVQGLWITDPPLLQLARRQFPQSKILSLRDQGITQLPQLMEMPYKDLLPLLGKPAISELGRMPRVEVQTRLVIGTGSGDVQGKLAEGEVMLIFAAKKLGGEQRLQTKYGKWKEPAWYLVLGNEATNQVIRCVRFGLRRETKLKLTFVWTEAMKDVRMKLYLISDSYIGLDQVVVLNRENGTLEGKEAGYNKEEYRSVDREADVEEPEAAEAPAVVSKEAYKEESTIIEKALDTW